MEHNLGVALGLITGIAVGLLLIVLLFRKRILDCTFDERQERARGVAFKYGFFTLMGAMLVYGLSELTFGRWCDAMAGACLCLAAGVLVFAVICIAKDAYLSLKEKPRYVMTLFTMISAANLVLGVIGLHGGELMDSGILTFRCTNLIVGIMTAVILVVYIVNFFLRQREEEAE